MSSKTPKKQRNKNIHNSQSQQTLTGWLSKTPVQNVKEHHDDNPKIHFKKEKQHDDVVENILASSHNITRKKIKSQKRNSSSSHESPMGPKKTHQSTKQCSELAESFEKREKLLSGDTTKKKFRKSDFSSNEELPSFKKKSKQRKKKNATEKCYREKSSLDTTIHNNETVKETFTKRSSEKIAKNKNTAKKSHRDNSPNTTTQNSDGTITNKFNSESNHELLICKENSLKETSDQSRNRLNISDWLTKNHPTEERKTDKTTTKKRRRKRLKEFNSSSSHESPMGPIKTNQSPIQNLETTLPDADINKKTIHRSNSSSNEELPSFKGKTNSSKQRKNKNAMREKSSPDTTIHNSDETVREASTKIFQRHNEWFAFNGKTKSPKQTDNKSTAKKRHRENSPNTTTQNTNSFDSGSSLESPIFKETSDQRKKTLSNTSGWLTKSHTTEELKATIKKPREKKLKKPPLNLHTKTTSTKTLARFNSASSDELPTFREKVPTKKSKQTETFKKYGVLVPQIDEIIADQQRLSAYKMQVEEAQALSEPSLNLPSSPKKAKVEERVLDCKHLTVEDIGRHFNDNASFLSDIMNGKRSSIRHRRYYDKKNPLDNLTMKDLTYSTSTIVFSFEQLDHVATLMQEQFDPDDQKTCYFFKVLIPELCLKIFMDTYNMSKREANHYLDNRPI